MVVRSFQARAGLCQMRKSAMQDYIKNFENMYSLSSRGNTQKAGQITDPHVARKSKCNSVEMHVVNNLELYTTSDSTLQLPTIP
eukprot:897886-Pyramimonas_sp.AAC.4